MYGYNEMSDRLSWELHGYYIHLECERDSPSVVDYHTHGLCHSRGKQDFRIEAPIDPFLAVSIFRELVELMDQGMDINPGQRLEDVVPDVVLEITQASDEIDMLTISLSEASLAD